MFKVYKKLFALKIQKERHISFLVIYKLVVDSVYIRFKKLCPAPVLPFFLCM